jgi:hypothetical protein
MAMKSLIVVAGLALALAACASSGTTDVKRATVPSGLPLGCVPNTQTQRCDQFGTYYSGDDLRNTGAQHVGHALNMVDPALTH